MGALSFWGGMAGAGKGLADIGAGMAASEERRMRDEREAQMREELQREKLQAQREAAAARAPAAGAGGARAGALSVLDVADNPELLASLGGMSREQADDVIAMSKGRTPMRQLEDDGSGFSATEMPKYTPGQAAELRAEKTRALRTAMKVVNPQYADDLSKSERTDQGTRFAQEYRDTGSELAGTATLINDSKGAYDDGSSLVSGRAAKGSMTEAKIKTESAKQGAEGALARKRSEEAKSEVDKREGKASVKDDLAIIDGQRKKIDARLADIRAREALATKMGDDTELASAREERKKVQAQADQLDNDYTRLSQRLSEGTNKPATTKGDANTPPANMLKEGVNTRFKNGQVWTLRGGKPVKVN